MNDFSTVRSTNHRIDMTKCIDLKGETHHFEAPANFLREDYNGLRELCDVRLNFENESVPVHSLMLAAFSSTFANKLRKADKCYEMDLKFLNKESVKRVLEFIYNQKVTLKFGKLQDDLEAIAYFGIGGLQEEVEKKLCEMASRGKCVDVLNLITYNLKTIPHSPSTMLAVSDETVRDIVSNLHEMSVNNQLPYEEILKLTTNTVITMLSSRISDIKKVDIINMALKWIYEHRLSDHKASNILCGLTFGSMTYAELVHFRNSLIQTAIPVTVGRCVRLKRGENDTLDIVFTYAESSVHQPLTNKPMTTSSFTFESNGSAPSSMASLTKSNSSHTKFESGYSTSYDCNFDDCNTAMSFDQEDLKRLGYDKPSKK